MSDQFSTSDVPVNAPVTFEEAVRCSARLLRHAEMETNLMLMERFESLAQTWLCLAESLRVQDRQI